MPLLVFALAVLGVATYLFVTAKPGLTVGQKIDIARTFLRHDRPEAAVEQAQKILSTDKMEPAIESQVHLLLGEAIDLKQRQRKLPVTASFQAIIDQTQLALSQGVKPDAKIHRRLGEAYEGMNRPAEALANYRLAIAMDPELTVRLQKKVVELQIANEESAAATASLDAFLHNKGLTDSERAWAMGQQAQIAINRGDFAGARGVLNDALRMELDPIAQGETNYRLGFAAWKLGENDEAEHCLRLAREQLQAKHPLDADACYLLGKIYQDKGEPEQANTFYQTVLTDYVDAECATGARLGRGICRIMLGEDEVGLSDLRDLVTEVSGHGLRSRLKNQTIEGLRRATDLLCNKNNFQAALETLSDEQLLTPEPQASFYSRLASVYEKRADQVESAMADTKEADRVRRSQESRDLRTKAGDAYISCCRALTLVDDKGYGEALWKGVDLYDRAGESNRMVSALELFVAERPADSLAAEALLRLGKAYQTAGAYDKAIAALVKNQSKYPQSLSASKSALPLAQSLIAKGPENFTKAEGVLRSMVEGNKLITPITDEYKQALFELAQLYYRTGRFEESLVRLTEWTEHYSKDPRMGQALFLMADSYRKSSEMNEARLASAGSNETSNAAVTTALAEKRARLTKARELYDRVIEGAKSTPSDREIDLQNLKFAYFYRADCAYDLGLYDEAIRLYDAVALKYRDDPSAVAANVQIVNSYFAMGKKEEAKAANERAKWLLRRMPNEAFSDGSFAMPKGHWEQWLKWTGETGM